MKLKKLLALLCVCVLALSLAVPAFAADDDATSGNIRNPLENPFEGADPNDGSLTVSVAVLPGANKLYVNPYGLPYTVPDRTGVDIDGEAGSAVAKIVEGTTTAGWFSTTSLLQNNSDSNLKVKVTMTTTEKGGVKVVEVPVGGSAPTNVQDNTLYGYLEINTAAYDQTKGTITPTWTGAKKVPVPAGSGTAGQAGTPVKDVDPTDGTTPGFTLNKATTTEIKGEMVTTPTYAAFRIRGSAVMPASGSNTGASNGDIGWAKADLADVLVAFSFETVPSGTVSP